MLRILLIILKMKMLICTRFNDINNMIDCFCDIEKNMKIVIIVLVLRRDVNIGSDNIYSQ